MILHYGKDDNYNRIQFWKSILKEIQADIVHHKLSSLLATISTDLNDALGDLLSACNVEIEDIETSQQCIQYLKDSWKTSSTILNQTKDPLIAIFAASLVIVTSFFKSSNFLVMTDDEDDDNNANQNDDNKNDKTTDKQLKNRTND